MIGIKRLALIRVLLLIAIAAVAVIIFLFSAQSGSQSKQVSDQLTDRVARVVVRGYRTMTEKERQSVLTRLSLSIRKLAHFSEFALLAALIAAYRGVSGARILPLAWVFAALYACTDEIHQMFVADRGPSPIDVGIDSLGALFGAGAVALIAAAIKKRAKK